MGTMITGPMINDAARSRRSEWNGPHADAHGPPPIVPLVEQDTTTTSMSVHILVGVGLPVDLLGLAVEPITNVIHRAARAGLHVIPHLVGG